MSHRQTVCEFAFWKLLASEEPSSNNMSYASVIWTFPWLRALILYLTCHGWSAVGGEQLRQTNTPTLRHFIC